MTQEDWNQAAPYYESSYQSQYRRADKLEKQLIKKLLEQFPYAQTVLEVGCGTAHFTKWLQTEGYQCVGLDISSGMLKEAKRLWGQGSLIRGDGLHLPLPDKSVDLTVFITSLEFIPDAAAALSEATRVARQGILLGFLNKNSFSAFKRRLQPKRAPLFSSAVFYSLPDINRVLAKTVVEYEIVFWSTTVFPRIFGNLESKALPFGDFLGIAVKLS